MAKRFEWSFKKTKIPSPETMYRFIKFYVWECPVKGVSVKGKTLADYGWVGSSINTLRREIRKQSTLTQETFKTVDVIDDLSMRVEQIGVSNSYDLSKEFAICYAGDRTHTDAFFYMIRNAIAHGSFCVRTKNGDSFLVLEAKKGDKLRGRAILRLSTLESIEKAVKHSDRYLTNMGRA